MKWQMAAVVLLTFAGVATLARAADPRYPDWPCTQAKVPEISVAAVWAGPPLDDAAQHWKDDATISALVARLAARRTPLDEAQTAITDVLAKAGDQKARRGTLLFAGLFETLNAQRSQVMTGLERVTRKQRDAAERIRGDTLALHALQDNATADPAKLDELANQVLWQTRIFEDRQRVVKFVCEVPTAIDQRLFALARMIQQELE